MNHKETAEQLIDTFIQSTRNRLEKQSMSYRRAKTCATIHCLKVIELTGNDDYKLIIKEIEKL